MSYDISGLGKPQNGGAFPVIEDVDLLGGHQVQPTTSGRDAIPTLNLKIGMTCYVVETSTTYRLGSVSPVTWAAVTSGAAAPAGTGPVKASGGAFSVGAIDLATAEVVGTLPAARGGYAAPTGNGFGRIVSGVLQGAAALVNLASDVTGTLPAANGGYAAPTGSGFGRIVGGVLQGAAALINLASDVTGTLPAANVAVIPIATGTSGTLDLTTRVTGVLPSANMSAPTGSGFTHITAGARDAAAKLVDLAADINTATLLPGPNGGGVPSVVKQFTTTDATATPVTETATTLTAFQAGDFLATIIARTGAGAMYRVELLATYVANAGGPVVLTQVNPPTLQNAFGALSGLVITYAVSAGVVTLQVTGVAATTIYWDIVQIARVV